MTAQAHDVGLNHPDGVEAIRWSSQDDVKHAIRFRTSALAKDKPRSLKKAEEGKGAKQRNCAGSAGFSESQPGGAG